LQFAVEASGIEKTFVKKRSLRELVTRPFARAERVRALRGVDLQVRPGEIFGLLGPNGAGKTTLLKILSCLVLPDRGRAVVAGFDTTDEYRVKPNIGLIHPDERSFYWRLSARENLRFFATLYDVPARRAGPRIEHLLEKLDLLEVADRRFSDFSSGMKQRLAIARALLHDPPILLMDEPTRSLDPAAALSLRTFVREELQRRDGKTILLATHNLREAETLCDRIAILVRGRIRQVGTVEEVRRWGAEDRRFRLEVGSWPAGLAGPFRILSDEASDGGRRVDLVLEPGASLDDLLRLLIGAGISIRACDRVEPDLEEAFAKILGEATAPEAAPA
jgi:ABC-2 type transport system ATP-binding protein